MASRELELILRLRDEASAEIKKAAGGIDNMKPAFQKMALYGTAAFGAITYGASQAVNAAAENEGAWNKFNTVFGEHAEEMGDWITEIRTKLPSATTDVVKMASGVQDLLIPMGFARDEAMGMTQETIELANALAAFNDVPVEQVLNAMISGFTGMIRPLKQFGIDIPIERLEQMAINQGIVTNGFKDLDYETRRTVQAQLTLQAAYEDSADALAGLEVNQDSYNRRQQALRADIADLVNAIGNTLLPIFDSMIKILLPTIKKIEAFVKENEGLVKVMIILAGAISGIVAVLGMLGLAIIVIKPAIIALAGAWAALNVATIAYTAVVLAIIVVFQLMWKELKKVADSVGGFRNLWEWAWLQIEYIILTVTRGIIGSFESILRMIPVFGDAFGGLFDFLDRRIIENRGHFNDLAMRAMPEVGKAAEETGDALNDLGYNFAEVMESASQAASGTSESLSKIKKEVEDINQEIADANKKFKDLMASDEENYYNSLARKVAQHQVDIETMREEAEKAEIEGNDKTAQSLFQKINEKQKELNDFYTWDIDINSEIAWEKKKLQMGEIERVRVNYLEKKKMALEEQVETLRLLQERKEEKEAEANSEIVLIQTTTKAHIEGEKEKTRVTEQELRKRELLKFKAASILSSASSSISSTVNSTVQSVRDAIITPQGQVIQTDPADYLIATKTPGALAGGGGIVINIDKVIGSDRRAAESFANEIARIIKHEVKY